MQAPSRPAGSRRAARGTSPAGAPKAQREGLLWWTVGGGVALVTAALVRLPGPPVVDPDATASVLYFDRLVHGRRLEEPLLSTPKPMLTLLHGLAWTLTSDWRALTVVTVLAFAVAVTLLARVAVRLGGPAAGAAAVVVLLGFGPLVLEVSRANSVVFALAAWAVAADALCRPDRRWRRAGVALLIACLSRSEGWLLLPMMAAVVVLAWRRGERGAVWLLLAFTAPPLWLAHDWLLTGDLLYSAHVPERYTDLISGRHRIAPEAWVLEGWRRYAATPGLLVLAAVGVAALWTRKAWTALVGAAVLGPGVLVLFGAYAARGTYISFRYFDLPDIVLRWLAAIAIGAIAGMAAPRLFRRPSAGVLAGAFVALALAWPVAPAAPGFASTLRRNASLSANTAAAIPILRRALADDPSAAVLVPGPQRSRIALELGRPLLKVKDIALEAASGRMPRALGNVRAVFHDSDWDGRDPALRTLENRGPVEVAGVRLEPALLDPGRGLYVVRVVPSR